MYHEQNHRNRWNKKIINTRRVSAYSFASSFLLLQLIIIVPSAVFAQHALNENSFLAACWFALIFNGIQLIIIKKIQGVDFFSFPMLYAISLALFTLSAFLLYLINGPSGLGYLRYVNYDYLARTIPYISVAFAAFALGVSLGAKGRVEMSRPDRRPTSLLLRELLLVTIFSIVLLASYGWVIFETVRGAGFRILLEGNYHDFARAQGEGNMTRLFVASMTWFIPYSSIIISTILKSRLRRWNGSDLIMVVSILLLLAAGDRGNALACFAAWLAVHQASTGALDVRKFVGVAAIGVVFVPLFQVLRTIPLSSWSFGTVIETTADLQNLISQAHGSFLQALFGPYSSTVMTFMGTLMRLDDGAEFQMGFDYLKALGATIPFHSELAPGNNDIIHEYLIPGLAGGPGFMAVGELFLNFHVAGVVFGHLVLGFGLMRLWSSASMAALSPSVLAFGAVVFFALLLWIRNEFIIVLRTTLWAGFCIFLVAPGLASLLGERRRSASIQGALFQRERFRRD